MPDTQPQPLPNTYPDPLGMPSETFNAYFQSMSDEFNRRYNLSLAPEAVTDAARNYVYCLQRGGEDIDLTPLHDAVDAALPKEDS